MWKIVPNDPNVEFAFDAPKEYITLAGTLTIDNDIPAKWRYGHSEETLLGKELTVIIEKEITDMTNGIGTWTKYPIQRAGIDLWYPDSSHVKNTLLNDEEFNRLVNAYVFSRTDKM